MIDQPIGPPAYARGGAPDDFAHPPLVRTEDTGLCHWPAEVLSGSLPPLPVHRSVCCPEKKGTCGRHVAPGSLQDCCRRLTKMTEFGEGNKPASYKRIVLKNASEYHYLKIHLEFQEADFSLNAVEFKQLIISALKRLHGEVGAALLVDVLTYEEETLSAVLRVPNVGLAKLWSALTLFGSYQNRKCAFRVIQTSPFLLALAGNSRELVLD
uniref:ribonuclease P protein subunit p14 isoform X2 n=1 Tax=Podarcis muralis TaxID=64176 RepID=UPI00109EF547|nr:ribonuclease P protein subunit p14 isoform X2 [Podarcis muralis]